MTAPTAPAVASDLDGKVIDVEFANTARTLRGIVEVDDDLDLHLVTSTGRNVLVASRDVTRIVVQDGDDAAPTPPSDMDSLISAEHGCARCGVDDFGTPLQRAVAVVVAAAGTGFGLCGYHFRTNRDALFDRAIPVVYLLASAPAARTGMSQPHPTMGTSAHT